MVTSRRGVADDSPTLGGFLDSIIGARQEHRTRAVDYLADPTRVARWLKLLPSDPLQAKDAAFAVLSDQNSAKYPFTPERTEALFLFDRGIHAYLLRLETDYLAAQVGGELEEVLWRACSELSRAMIVSYERAFNENLERMGSRAALLTVTLIIVRMLHYLAWQARLTAYKRSDWIPGRWQQLHRLFRKARAFNIHLHGVSDLSDPAKARKTSIESEYLSLLLMWRLASGTLSRTELAQAYYWLKDRPRTIVFATTPRPGTRLAIDPTQAEGLKPLAQLTGPGERYLFDSTVLLEPLTATITRLEERAKTNPREPEATRLRQQIELVRYLLTHWAVNGFTERQERIVVDRPVEGFAGMPSIVARLQSIDEASRTMTLAAPEGKIGAAGALAAHEAKNVAHSKPKLTSGVRRNWDEPQAATVFGPGWTVRDQSSTGCRVVAPWPKNHPLKVGDVIAMNDAFGAWDVALVRRWKLAGDDRVEMGLLWLARNARALQMFAVQTDDRDAVPEFALGGEPQGGDHRILLALVPASVSADHSQQWERAVPEGKAVLMVDATELSGPDWAWVRMRVVSVAAGAPGLRNESEGGGVHEIEITAPRE
jgi:hypothetical protein